MLKKLLVLIIVAIIIYLGFSIIKPYGVRAIQEDVKTYELENIQD